VTEKQKMLAGELYLVDDPELIADRQRCEALLRRVNDERDEAAFDELLGSVGVDAWVRTPFYCDYGYNISLGTNVFINYNCVLLDCAPIVVGHRAQLGPAVQLLAADHPRDPAQRRAGLEFAKPIDIGPNAWLGGGALVCPGVSIGANSVIGAGSVVTRDIPANVVAVGNPCRVLRKL
jgi:maltose O-acetyltransferase